METDRRDRELTVVAEFASLAQIREHVADLAAVSGADDDTVDLLRLVVSELATNAIQYDEGSTLTVRAGATDSVFSIELSNAAGLDDLDTVALPEPSELAGRGLFLVGHIMDDVELIDIDGRRHVRCVKRLA